jgi:hypothetical protein
MKKSHILTTFLALGLLSVPALSHAQTVTLATYIGVAISFINDYLIPLIAAIAFLFFIWGMVKYFIIGATNESSRESGSRLAIWGIATFVVIVSAWGLVNMLITGFGVENPSTVPCPDYGRDRNPNC